MLYTQRKDHETVLKAFKEQYNNLTIEDVTDREENKIFFTVSAIIEGEPLEKEMRIIYKEYDNDFSCHVWEVQFLEDNGIYWEKI